MRIVATAEGKVQTRFRVDLTPHEYGRIIGALAFTAAHTKEEDYNTVAGHISETVEVLL